MFARLLVLVALAITCTAPATAQESYKLVTRTLGTMYAADLARDALGLPPDPFRYELLVTSTFQGSNAEEGDTAVSEFTQGSLVLSAGGDSRTIAERDGWAHTSARFSPADNGYPPSFEHGMLFGYSPYGFGVDGSQRGRWPQGADPAPRLFVPQAWSVDGEGVGSVYFNLSTGGERAGTLIGIADHFDMRISPVPEPAMRMLAVPGLLVLAVALRLRRRLLDGS